ncbi:Hypothetical protein GLP15_4985 [Giardia lamblia P15]|uniref:Uncharacterized protein n=1 Tax=Giardia intestinalis (strain P15) TaxID=658858 RepID=E1F719_GIAIA|nr:Hypothetical protein GLP15_4985 [Giardia lamblia P15]
MHVSLDIDMSPSSRLPAGKWLVIRAGIQDADPETLPSLTQKPLKEVQKGPQKTWWFFTKMLAKEKGEHLDHHNYTVRVPRATANVDDLSSILLVDLLVQGVLPDECTTCKHSWLNTCADGNDTVLLGRYRVSLADLLSSWGQSQSVSITSLIEDSKLANLAIQYQQFAGTRMDKQVIVTMDRPGARGYLSLCACTKEAGHTIYDVVYQDITSGMKTGPTFELAIPYDILLCYSSSYGLAIADKGETGIPVSSVINSAELKKMGRDLLISPRDNQTSVSLPSNTSLSTSSRLKQSTISLKYIDKQYTIDQILYVIIDNSVSLRFECLKLGVQTNARMLLQKIFEETSRMISDVEPSSDERKKPLLRIPWMDVPVPGVKGFLEEAIEVLQSHIAGDNTLMRASGLSERPFGRSSYDTAISKRIYALALSNDVLHSINLRNCISECSSVVFLLFCFMHRNLDPEKLLAQYSNVIIFDILQPNYDQLQHVLLSICSCIRYNAESERRSHCICGYHIR